LETGIEDFDDIDDEEEEKIIEDNIDNN